MRETQGCSYVTSYYSLVVSCKYVLSFIPDHKISQGQVISFLFPIEKYQQRKCFKEFAESQSAFFIHFSVWVCFYVSVSPLIDCKHCVQVKIEPPNCIASHTLPFKRWEPWDPEKWNYLHKITQLAYDFNADPLSAHSSYLLVIVIDQYWRSQRKQDIRTGKGNQPW